MTKDITSSANTKSKPNKIITVKNFKKSYGEVQAVKGITFKVNEGELFAFLGPNGAGKSTTINALCTLYKVEEGEISIAGYDLKKQPNKVKKSIGVVFQESVLDKKLTVKENLMIRAGFYYKNRDERKKEVERVIEQTEIEDILKRKYEKLSGGQRRRVDIARALLNRPKVLFLDEPTTGLDPQTRKLIWELIRELQQTYKTSIFLTTHYMEEAEKADYVIIIDDGLIVAEDTPSKLKERFSTDHIKVYLKDMKYKEDVKKYLFEKNLKYTQKQEVFDIAINESFESIYIAEDLEKYISSFEVLHGTMDDVFINITGKEIRS